MNGSNAQLKQPLGLDRRLALKCLALALRPLARFCLRHSIKLQEATECLKNVLLEAAREQLSECNEKVTHSRLHVMTGVHRKDVVRLENPAAQSQLTQDLITKVIGKWQTDHSFITTDGKAKVLTFNYPRSEFSTLVYSVSRELNPATVLFELRRVGAIQETHRGLKLLTANYIPKKNAVRGFEILSKDIGDLLSSGEENVFLQPELPAHHLRTEFDRVRGDAIPSIQQWLLREGHQFHLKVRNFLAQFDQDINPELSFKGETTRVAVTSFGKVGN